jgi:7-cyano-7-deazaguanine synthase
MSSEMTVVLNSGGLNSAVATACVQQDGPIALLHVIYPHRAHEREAGLFEKQAAHFKAREQLVLKMQHIGTIGGNARVSRNRQIVDALAMGEGPSSCHVPGMIGTFLSTAFSWANAIGASRVVIGVSENLGPPAPRTSSIYPDYSREFIQLFSHIYEVATVKKSITLEAPLIEMTRNEIVRLGHRLSVPFDMTWSCLSSGQEACGGCAGCATRARGFLDAAQPDPLFLTAAAAAR